MWVRKMTKRTEGRFLMQHGKYARHRVMILPDKVVTAFMDMPQGRFQCPNSNGRLSSLMCEVGHR